MSLVHIEQVAEEVIANPKILLADDETSKSIMNADDLRSIKTVRPYSDNFFFRQYSRPFA